MSAGQYDQRITTYFGEGVLRAGFMPVPHLLMRHYRRVGLSAAQAMFVLQIMESNWDLGEPPRTVRALAQRMGVDSRTIRKYAEEIRRLGLMRLYDQFDDHGAQVENGYDLTPLFQRLADLAPTVMPRGMQRRRELREGEPEPILTLADVTTISVAASHLPPSDHLIHTGGGSGDPSPQVLPVLPTPEQMIRSSGSTTSALKRKTNQKQQESSWQELLLSAAGSLKRCTDASQVVESRNTGSKSLRLGTTLTPEEIEHSTRLLQQIGVGEPVRSRIAPTLAPTEVWSLWCYGQARCWPVNLLISQVYNKNTHQPQPATELLATHDTVGNLLITLEPAVARHLVELVALHAPAHPGAVLADPLLDGAPASMLHIAAATWTMMSDLRTKAGDRLRTVPLLPSPATSTVAAFPDTRSSVTNSSLQQTWHMIQEELAGRVSSSDWETWLKPNKLLELDDKMVVLGTPNIFVRQEVEQRYADLVQQAFEQTLGYPVQLLVVISPLAYG